MSKEMHDNAVDISVKPNGRNEKGRVFTVGFSDHDGGMITSINLAEHEMQNLAAAIDRVYYREDVLDYFCGEDSKYDADRLAGNEKLIDEMTDFYAKRRSDHDSGGCVEDVAHWTVSMRETENEFADRLAEYEI